ncbi:hypothetical protein EI94DRAFT_1748137 [Lactarius quietus]|nr:hypothetical protein EI94DRAFT_1748137 [Lactarius quietus]
MAAANGPKSRARPQKNPTILEIGQSKQSEGSALTVSLCTRRTRSIGIHIAHPTLPSPV